MALSTIFDLAVQFIIQNMNFTKKTALQYEVQFLSLSEKAH